MFSPLARLPSYYSDNDCDYLRALAQQRARERREAQYRAQLEAIRRQAYQEQFARQEAARRRNSLFFGGFDEEPGWSPRRDYLPNDEDDIWTEINKPFDTPARRPHVDENLHPGKNHMNSPHRESHKVSIPITESQADIKTNLSEPSCRADTTRDAAARKIQAFARRALPCIRSLRTITAISQQFAETQESFHFPSELDFDASARTDATPPLLFTSRNAPLHAHEHALVKLLSALDAVDSHGDIRVRGARKHLVKRIETALAVLDAQKEEMWQDMRGGDSAPSRAEMPDDLAKGSPCEPESVSMDLEKSPSGLKDSSSEEDEVEMELSSRPEEIIPGDEGTSGSS